MVISADMYHMIIIGETHLYRGLHLNDGMYPYEGKSSIQTGLHDSILREAVNLHCGIHFCPSSHSVPTAIVHHATTLICHDSVIPQYIVPLCHSLNSVIPYIYLSTTPFSYSVIPHNPVISQFYSAIIPQPTS